MKAKKQAKFKIREEKPYAGRLGPLRLRGVGKYPSYEEFEEMKQHLKTLSDWHSVHGNASEHVHGKDPALRINGFDKGLVGKDVIVAHFPTTGHIKGRKPKTTIGPYGIYLDKRKTKAPEWYEKRKTPTERRSIFDRSFGREESSIDFHRQGTGKTKGTRKITRRIINRRTDGRKYS